EKTKLKLEEVKLVPGVMPMIYCDLHAVWGALRWEKEDATVEVEAEGETVKIYSSVDDKHGRCRGEGWVTLSYDPDKGYVWDKRVRVKILKDDTFPKWHLNVVDPKFYQTVAPATDKLPTCRNAPNYAIYKHKSGEIASFPVNHQFKNGATLSPQDLLIERGGYWVTTVDNWGAVTTLPEDNAYQYAGDYCYWGLDQHILPIVDGEVEAAFKQKHKKKAKKGDVYEGHARLYAWSPQQVRQALEKAIHPYDEKVAKAPLLYHIEPVNHFEKTVPLLAGDSKVRWVGDYAIDREEGRDGSRCMRIEAGSTSSNIGHHRVRAGKPPNMQIGPSFRTGPYPARLYRIGFWVRSKGFEGRVSLKIDRINYPPGSKEGRPDKLEESINLEEGSEWKHVALETPLPHLAHAWTMNIAPKGKGTLFVDDFEIVPIEQ
ncbi:MAG: hypothetical protein KGZ25_14705, partial [Planctomycetes bacterium]|nr:hypothetical protein [Planctomycetota bacterium]